MAKTSNFQWFIYYYFLIFFGNNMLLIQANSLRNTTSLTSLKVESMIKNNYIKNISTSSNGLYGLSSYRRLADTSSSATTACDSVALQSEIQKYSSYMNGMNKIYSRTGSEGTCFKVHEKCGWTESSSPSSSSSSLSSAAKEAKSNLPLFVLSVGLEGAGHHLWTELMDEPIFDCTWTNARHYDRSIADGVPRTSAARLHEGISEQLKLRLQSGKPACKRIYDSEDSFPTGAIRKNGRVFMRPDIVNVELLDGLLYRSKYLIILRNITDTAMSALRRNFFSDVDMELRTVEHTLTYIESAMRIVPCHKTMIVHYEHVMRDPQAFVEPLAAFLELSAEQKQALERRMRGRKGRRVKRKSHKLTQFNECKDTPNEIECYQKIHRIMQDFFIPRGFMWPTFAANGFDIFN